MSNVKKQKPQKLKEQRAKFQAYLKVSGVEKTDFVSELQNFVHKANGTRPVRTTVLRWIDGISPPKKYGSAVKTFMERKISPGDWAKSPQEYELALRRCSVGESAYNFSVLNYMIEKAHFCESQSEQIRKLQPFTGNYLLVRESLGDEEKALICPLTILIRDEALCHFLLNEVTLAIEGFVYAVDIVLMLTGVGRDISDEDYSFHWAAFLDPDHAREFQVFTGTLLERAQSLQQNCSLATSAFICISEEKTPVLYRALKAMKAVEPISELEDNPGKFVDRNKLPMGLCSALKTFKPVHARLTKEVLAKIKME